MQFDRAFGHQYVLDYLTRDILVPRSSSRRVSFNGQKGTMGRVELRERDNGNMVLVFTNSLTKSHTPVHCIITQESSRGPCNKKDALASELAPRSFPFLLPFPFSCPTHRVSRLSRHTHTPTHTVTMAPLGSIDPNLPSNAASATAATPKDKMRQWTFPRNTAAASTASTATSSPLRNANTTTNYGTSQDATTAVVHAHSSSISPAKSKEANAKSRMASKDFRHRTNASLVYTPASAPASNPPPPAACAVAVTPPSSSGPFMPALSSTASLTSRASRPRDIVTMIYSNARRRSAQDIVHLVIFGGCLALFALALTGRGYDAQQQDNNLSLRYRSMPEQPVETRLNVIDVKIPDTFLPKDVLDDGDAASRPQEGELLDAHQLEGDTSDDAGVEHFADSPADPSLEPEAAQ